MKTIKPNLTTKLVMMSVATSLIALFAVGIYFYLFLEQDNSQKIERSISSQLHDVTQAITQSKETLIKQIGFLEKDVALFSSIYLIHNYEDKMEYNAALLDEEKKLIAEKLLKQAKFSFTDRIVLFGENKNIIAGVEKQKEGDYLLFFSTFIDGELNYYATSEKLISYQINYDMKQVYKPINADDEFLSDIENIISYGIENTQLVAKAYHVLHSQKNSNPMAYTEVSKVFSDAFLSSYLANQGDSLFMQPEPPEEHLECTWCEFGEITMDEDSNFYIGKVTLHTQDGPLSIVSKQNKATMQELLQKTRKNFLAIFVIVASVLVLVMYVVYRVALMKPLSILMQNIANIKERNFDEIVSIKTNDEIEDIFDSIDKLAQNVDEKEKKLIYLAEHDALTGLYSRYYLNGHLARAIENIDMDNKNEHIALMFLDIDQFKFINDTLGHKIGDLLLVAVANRLSSYFEDIGSISRIGGDEFIILIENITNDKYSHEIAQKVIELFESPFQVERHSIKTSVSMGIVLAYDDNKPPDTLFKHADIALYKSKERGRNRFTFYEDSFSKEITRKSKIIDELKRAISSFDEFKIVYQPKVSLKTEKPRGVEALIRWENNGLGIVSPSEFIPIAEESGLIIELGNKILLKACSDIVALQNEGIDIKQLSINVSTIQLRKKEFVQELSSIISKTKINPKVVELEITERYIAADTQEALRTLQKIRDLGIGLAIDDFGTGYSSLSYLKKLPITHIKIDKSFIDELSSGGESLAIVKAIIALAKTFDLLTTAEGVETKAQIDFLKEEQCDEIQGYYFAKPMCLEDLKAYWKAQLGCRDDAPKNIFFCDSLQVDTRGETIKE